MVNSLSALYFCVNLKSVYCRDFWSVILQEVNSLCNRSSLVFVHINLYNLFTSNCDGSTHIFSSMLQDTKASALVRLGRFE